MGVKDDHRTNEATELNLFVLHSALVSVRKHLAFELSHVLFKYTTWTLLTQCFLNGCQK